MTSTPGERLEPCKFCGGVAAIIPRPTLTKSGLYGAHTYYVQCTQCRASTAAFAMPDFAIAAWNRRPTAPASGLGEEWVLVPREPTEEMVAAAVHTLRLPWREIQRIMEAYRAMVAALYPPPRDGGRGASSTESAAGSATRDAAGDAQRKSEGE